MSESEFLRLFQKGQKIRASKGEGHAEIVLKDLIEDRFGVNESIAQGVAQDILKGQPESFERLLKTSEEPLRQIVKSQEELAFKQIDKIDLHQVSVSKDGPGSYTVVDSDRKISKDDDGIVIYGPASVAIVDRENDLITGPALKAALPQLLKRGRLSLQHMDILIGEILPVYKTADREVFTEVRPLTKQDLLEWPKVAAYAKEGDDALFVVGKIYNDNRFSKDITDKILKGEVACYSISGQAVQESKRMDCSGFTCKLVNEISAVELSAVTACVQGMQPAAHFNVLSKEDTNKGVVMLLKEQKVLSEDCGCSGRKLDKGTAQIAPGPTLSQLLGVQNPTLQAVERSAPLPGTLGPDVVAPGIGAAATGAIEGAQAARAAGPAEESAAAKLAKPAKIAEEAESGAGKAAGTVARTMGREAVIQGAKSLLGGSNDDDKDSEKSGQSKVADAMTTKKPDEKLPKDKELQKAEELTAAAPDPITDDDPEEKEHLAKTSPGPHGRCGYCGQGIEPTENGSWKHVSPEDEKDEHQPYPYGANPRKMKAAKPEFDFSKSAHPSLALDAMANQYNGGFHQAFMNMGPQAPEALREASFLLQAHGHNEPAKHFSEAGHHIRNYFTRNNPFGPKTGKEEGDEEQMAKTLDGLDTKCYAHDYSPLYDALLHHVNSKPVKKSFRQEMDGILNNILKSVPPRDSVKTGLQLGYPQYPQGQTIKVTPSEDASTNPPDEDAEYYSYPSGSDRPMNSANAPVAPGKRPKGFYQKAENGHYQVNSSGKYAKCTGCNWDGPEVKSVNLPVGPNQDYKIDMCPDCMKELNDAIYEHRSGTTPMKRVKKSNPGKTHEQIRAEHQKEADELFDHPELVAKSCDKCKGTGINSATSAKCSCLRKSTCNCKTGQTPWGTKCTCVKKISKAYCPNCGVRKPHDRACGKCGADTICNYCGSALSEGDTECPDCGKKNNFSYIRKNDAVMDLAEADKLIDEALGDMGYPEGEHEKLVDDCECCPACPHCQCENCGTKETGVTPSGENSVLPPEDLIQKPNSMTGSMTPPLGKELQPPTSFQSMKGTGTTTTDTTPIPDNMVLKPGKGTHSDKWDRAVEHIKEEGNVDNPYAVATAALGEDSFRKHSKEFEEAAEVLRKEYNNEELIHKMVFAKTGFKVNNNCASCLKIQRALDTPKQYYDIMKAALESGRVNDSVLTDGDLMTFRREYPIVRKMLTKKETAS